MANPNAPATVDAYIATLAPEVQAVLQKIRATIREAAPEAEESVSYGIAAFTLLGRPLLYFAGFKGHTSVYPAPLRHPAFEARLAPYASGAGTAKFALGQPVPYDLLRDVARHRVEETLHTAAAKGTRRAPTP